MKHCSHCKTIYNLMPKPYAISKKGYQYYMCRNCNTERMKKYRKTKGAEPTYKAVRKSIEKHKLKQVARLKLSGAIKIGAVIKPDTCEKCHKPKVVEGHHEDYSHPLSVRWLCRQCHANIHRML